MVRKLLSWCKALLRVVFKWTNYPYASSANSRVTLTSMLQDLTLWTASAISKWLTNAWGSLDNLQHCLRAVPNFSYICVIKYLWANELNNVITSYYIEITFNNGSFIPSVCVLLYFSFPFSILHSCSLLRLPAVSWDINMDGQW